MARSWVRATALDRFRDLRAAGFGVKHGRSSLEEGDDCCAPRDVDGGKIRHMRPPLAKSPV